MIVDAQREARNLADQTQRLKRHAEGLTTGPDLRPIPEIAQWVHTLREINGAAGASMTALLSVGLTDADVADVLPWRPRLASPTTTLQGAVAAGTAAVQAYRDEGIEAAVQGACYGPLPDDAVSPHPVLTADVSALKPAVQAIIDALPI